jgi:hypothetical protein
MRASGKFIDYKLPVNLCADFQDEDCKSATHEIPPDH